MSRIPTGLLASGAEPDSAKPLADRRLAALILLGRKIRALKARGRDLTVRSLEQWLRALKVEDLDGVVLLKRRAGARSTWAEIARGKNGRGRPRKVSLQAEREWAMRLMGRRYREFAKLDGRFSLEDSLAVRRHIKQHPQDLAEVSLAAVLRLMEPRASVTRINCLAKRYCRAVKRMSLAVPDAKSGG